MFAWTLELDLPFYLVPAASIPSTHGSILGTRHQHIGGGVAAAEVDVGDGACVSQQTRLVDKLVPFQ